ncbi:uncharacterized protein, partial [Channa argus]|uniref:uncharacterized protein n=1 Tax=Channa argus TaxID=215402 RepID=UPI003520DCF3
MFISSETLTLFNMLSLKCDVFLLILLTINLTAVSCQDLTPVKTEDFSFEGSNVTLSCKYSKGAADYFFWYRQHPGKPPEFLISHLESGEIFVNPVSGLSVKVRKETTHMDLQISSAAVSDSAVYYCAVSPALKLCVFQSGAKLYGPKHWAIDLEQPKRDKLHVQHTFIHKTNMTSFNMLKLDCSLFSLLFLYSLTGVSCEGPTAVKDEEFSLEGSNISLSFTYSKLVTSDFFFWYQQHPGKPPQLLISHSASGTVADQHPRYNITVENKQITMIISSAAVSDSAVYYCAVQPTVTGNTTT